MLFIKGVLHIIDSLKSYNEDDLHIIDSLKSFNEDDLHIIDSLKIYNEDDLYKFEFLQLAIDKYAFNIQVVLQKWRS